MRDLGFRRGEGWTSGTSRRRDHVAGSGVGGQPLYTLASSGQTRAPCLIRAPRPSGRRCFALIAGPSHPLKPRLRPTRTGPRSGGRGLRCREATPLRLSGPSPTLPRLPALDGRNVHSLSSPWQVLRLTSGRYWGFGPRPLDLRSSPFPLQYPPCTKGELRLLQGPDSTGLFLPAGIRHIWWFRRSVIHYL